MKNVEGFDQTAAQRLVGAMNRAFPYAEVEPDEEHWRTLHQVSLPDEDDRHVLAASLAADATVLCTSNIKDFPAHIAEALGFEVLTPDQLLSRLVVEYGPHRPGYATRHSEDAKKRLHEALTIFQRIGTADATGSPPN